MTSIKLLLGPVLLTAHLSVAAEPAKPSFTRWLENKALASMFCGTHEYDEVTANYSRQLVAALRAAQAQGVSDAHALAVMKAKAGCPGSGHETHRDLLPGVTAVGEI